MFFSLLLFGLTACAVGGIMDGDVYQRHSFSFDVRQDMPDIEVLDYQYSNGKHNGIKPTAERVSIQSRDGGFAGEGIYGNLLRGDFLYVKWRVKDPHSPSWAIKYLGTYEDRVDLRSRLPADISDLTIHFIIRGTQLYVYLIWPYDAKHIYPSNEKMLFDRVKYIQIYPDITK
jgi:hypothetical protein